jgi:hypothetical protein
MAVPGLLDCIFETDRAAPARPVDHHDLRAKLAPHAFREHACGDVRGSPGGKQHDEFDRSPGRVRLLRRRWRNHREPRQDSQEPEN